MLFNNLPIVPEGHLICICIHVNIEVNVLTQNNIVASVAMCRNLRKTVYYFSF